MAWHLSLSLLVLVVFSASSLLPSPGNAALDLTAACPSLEGNSSEEGHLLEEEDECVKEEERPFDSSVRIARLEFHRVETIFIILVFIVVVVLAKMCKCNGV